jgi:hypothetical protein
MRLPPPLLEPLELVTEREQVIKDSFGKIEHILCVISRNRYVHIVRGVVSNIPHHIRSLKKPFIDKTVCFQLFK